MTNQNPPDQSVASGGPDRTDRLAWPLLGAAVAFVAFYLATDFVAPNLASSALPRPDDPVGQVRDWYAENQVAAVMIGVSQFLSVSFLGVFALLLPWMARTETQHLTLKSARTWGVAAMGLMMASSALGSLLASVAADAHLGTVDAMRTANFVAGGTAHVAVLGIFVWMASRAPGFGTPVRRLAAAAVGVALLSVTSLVLTFGAVFILLGRLLCMIWTVSAAVSIVRGCRNGRWA